MNGRTFRQSLKNILHEKANGLMANLSVLANNNEALKRCDPLTVVSAAVISASLDLPLDPNLGFAHVVPFGDKAQFMIGYKGFTQLAMRSGQYKTINVTEVYEGELISSNRITGEYVFDTTQRKSDKVIGFAAYFKLLNGYEKTEYWESSRAEQHGKRFSQTFKKGFGLWKDDFNAMGKKTVLKSLISKYGPMSIEMQKATRYDQSVTKDIETEYPEVEYVDNEVVHTIEENPQAIKVETPKPQEGKLL